MRLALERAVRSLDVTTAVARAVGGETDIDRVLELIVKRARALVQARGLTIMLSQGDELVVAATAGTWEPLPTAGLAGTCCCVPT